MKGQAIIKENKMGSKKNIYSVIEELLFNVLIFILIVFPIVGIYYIFKSCITDIVLLNTISLGSIFATFGSAIISSVVIIQSDKLERIFLNVDILFSELLHQEKWRRWPFIKRRNYKILFHGNSVKSDLDNPTISFKVVSNMIYISIPTIQEDFYDLPALKNYFTMLRYNKQLKTYIVTSKDSTSDANSHSEVDYYLVWECLYDIWRNIVLFKINKLIIICSISIVISSIIYSFGFMSINKYILYVLAGYAN